MRYRFNGTLNDAEKILEMTNHAVLEHDDDNVFQALRVKTDKGFLVVNPNDTIVIHLNGITIE